MTRANGAGGDGATPEPGRGGPAHVHGHRGPRASDPSDRRTLLLRLPVIAGLVAALVGAVVVDGSRDDGAADATGAPERIAALMPTSPPAGADSSTWYCTAGTADGERMADHTVVVLNPSDSPRRATVTAYHGDMVSRVAVGGDAPAPSSTTTTTAPSSTSTTTTPSTTTTTETAAPAPPPSDPVVHEVAIPPGEEVAVRLAELVEAPLAAALVEVDGGDVVVAHEVRGRHGNDSAPCQSVASSTWHLAWGSTTRDARDVIVLFNPYPSTATVDAVFTTDEGGRAPVRFQGLPVAGGSVVGVDVGDDVTRSEQVAATIGVRSGKVVVEHLQEYDGSLDTRGLSLTPAVPAAGETWVFPDGEAMVEAPATPAPDAATGEDDAGAEEDAAAEEDTAEGTEGEDDAAEDSDEPADDEPFTTERIVIYNPGDERADVDVGVIPTADDDESEPQPQPFGFSIGPGDYEIVDYGAEDRVPAGVPHATVVRSTNGVPVVAERVTSDRGPVASSASDSDDDAPDRSSEITATTGARLAAPTWRFPSVALPQDEESTATFTVYNPDPDAPVEVRLDLLPAPADDADPDESESESDESESDESESATEGDSGSAEDDETVDPTAPVTVPPGGRVAIEVDAELAAAAMAAVVDAERPVVAERVIHLDDGRRVSLGGGVPSADGAVVLDDMIAPG